MRTLRLFYDYCCGSCCTHLLFVLVKWMCYDVGETKNIKRTENMSDSNLLSRISPTNGSLSLSRISHNAKGSWGVSGSRRSIIEMV